MKITAIKQDKKHLSRICFEEGGSLLIDRDVCAERCIHNGDTLSVEQIKDLSEESDYRRAKQRALWLLDRYSYTERRLCEKLRQSGFGAVPAGRAVERLKELGLIDDAGSAARFAEDLARRGVSRRAAYSKLLLKGFEANTVKEALDNTEFDEGSQIRMLIERKYAAAMAAGQTDKVYAALIRKGFSYSAVRDAMRIYGEEIDCGGDE